MLIMRRRAGESFQIGPDIEIDILEIGHNRVKIGISAPAALSIVRAEVVIARDSNIAAAGTAADEAIDRLAQLLATSGRGAGRQENDSSDAVNCQAISDRNLRNSPLPSDMRH